MADGDPHVFPGFLIPELSFQSHRLLFSHNSHASAEVRGEKMLFASIESRTHNHQVMSPTHSKLIHPGGALGQIKFEMLSLHRVYPLPHNLEFY